jgi:plastocyanin
VIPPFTKMLAALSVSAMLTVASGCGTGGGPLDARAQTRVVEVDGSAPEMNVVLLSYFPRSITVHRGDTVRFKPVWTGEPHTVTMGTLADAFVSQALAALAAGRPVPPTAIPRFLAAGAARGIPSATDPCFLAHGVPSKQADVTCPRGQQPAFYGTQSYYNSGWLTPGAAFDVPIAPTTPLGTYRYYCILHGPRMSGEITVADRRAPMPSDAEVRREGTQERRELVDNALPAYGQAQEGKFALPGLANVAGYASFTAPTAPIYEFIPNVIRAHVGEKVIWTMFGVHTITFNPTLTPGDWIARDPTGSVTIRAAARDPVRFPGAPEPAETASAATVPRVEQTIDGGEYDGSGPKSTGLVESIPPSLYDVAVTFTRPGAYAYVCLIHPKMGGVVDVNA